MAGVNGDRKGKRDDNGMGTAIDFVLSNAKLVLGVGGAAMLGIATLAVKRMYDRTVSAPTSPTHKMEPGGKRSWEEPNWLGSSPRLLNHDMKSTVSRSLQTLPTSSNAFEPGAAVVLLPPARAHPRGGAGLRPPRRPGHLRRAPHLPARQAARHAPEGDVPEREPLRRPAGGDGGPRPADRSPGAGEEPVVAGPGGGHHHERAGLLAGAAGEPGVLPPGEQLLGPLPGGGLPLPEERAGGLPQAGGRLHQLAGHRQRAGLRDPPGRAAGDAGPGGAVRAGAPAAGGRAPAAGAGRRPVAGGQAAPLRRAAREPVEAELPRGRDRPAAGAGPGGRRLPLPVPEGAEGRVQAHARPVPPQRRPAHQRPAAAQRGPGGLGPGRAGRALPAAAARASGTPGGREAALHPLPQGGPVLRAHPAGGGRAGLHALLRPVRPRGPPADRVTPPQTRSAGFRVFRNTGRSLQCSLRGEVLYISHCEGEFPTMPLPTDTFHISVSVFKVFVFVFMLQLVCYETGGEVGHRQLILRVVCGFSPHDSIAMAVTLPAFFPFKAKAFDSTRARTGHKRSEDRSNEKR